MRLVVNAARWRIQFKDRSSKEVGASLECGDLSPLWYRTSETGEIRSTKAVTGPRTPRRRPSLVIPYALRLINLRWVVGLLVKTGAFRSMIKGKGLIAPDEA